MARPKVVPPPRTRVPAEAAGKSSASRYLVGGGVVAIVGVAVWLAVGLNTGNTPATSTTSTSTTSTTLKTSTGTPHQQIVTSLRDTQAIASAFQTAINHCASVACIDTAANVALENEGTTSNFVDQNSFPAGAQAAAQSYVQILQGLQSTYLQISESSTHTRVNNLLVSWRAGMKSVSTSASAVEKLL